MFNLLEEFVSFLISKMFVALAREKTIFSVVQRILLEVVFFSSFFECLKLYSLALAFS